MEIKNPILLHMVQMWQAISERDPEQTIIRSLYMVTKEVYELVLNPQTKQ